MTAINETQATTSSTTPARMRVLQADTCPSLSGRTFLDFQVGCNESEHLFIRIVRTSGGGFFSKEWVAYDSIVPLLVNPVTANSLRPIFVGKSVNTAGFLLAVVKHLGFVQLVPEALRGYQVIDNPAFIENTTKLIADGVDLPEDSPVVPGKKVIGKGKGIKKKAD